MFARALLGVVLMLGFPAYADSGAEAKANAAVAAILFDADADDFASYRVDERGQVDLLFASNTPDAIYSELLGKLQSHPDIKSVLVGKGGPACPRFR